METYQIAIAARVMTPNECRERENLPPLDGGDEFPPVAAPLRTLRTPPAAGEERPTTAPSSTLAGDSRLERR
jgi:hypothetical protein